MFESSVIVVYESLSCPRCEKMDLKIIPSLLELSVCKLLNGVIFINSAILFSCGLHVNIFYVKYLIQVCTK